MDFNKHKNVEKIVKVALTIVMVPVALIIVAGRAFVAGYHESRQHNKLKMAVDKNKPRKTENKPAKHHKQVNRMRYRSYKHLL
jgi:hypothetical protein